MHYRMIAKSFFDSIKVLALFLIMFRAISFPLESEISFTFQEMYTIPDNFVDVMEHKVNKIYNFRLNRVNVNGYNKQCTM